MWGFEETRQFAELKKILASTPVLALYRVAAETMVSADALEYMIEKLYYKEVMVSESRWHMLLEC